MNYKTIFLLAGLVLFACQTKAQEEKETRLEPFQKVKFEGSAQWELIPSEEEKVIVLSKKEEVFDYIDIHQKGNQLVVNTTDKNKNVTQLFKSVTIQVYFKSIESVYLSGVGSVHSKGILVSDQLTATLKGTGDMNLEVRCSGFTGNMHGTGTLEVDGSTNTARISVEGVGGFDGYNLVCKQMNVRVSGVGSAKVHASGSLTATLNGVGSIKYKGNPETKDFSTNGIGRIKKVD